MIRAGCGGFPVARATYFQALDTVELGRGLAKLPRVETAERLRREAPRDFVVSLPVARAVTEGQFRPTAEVRDGWEQTLRVARAADARFILFETPSSLVPNADRLRDLYAFFRSADRSGRILVWQAARGWNQGLLSRVCRDLKLVRAVDPLQEEPADGFLNYFRLRGGGPGRKPWRGYRYSDVELRQVADQAGSRPTYAYLLTADMWADARRLKALAPSPLTSPSPWGRGKCTPPTTRPPQGGE